MSLAVVRCPGCHGASRVPSDVLGQMVGCPRCQMPFVAEEDIPVVQPIARPAPRPAPPPVVQPLPRRPLFIEDGPDPKPFPSADAVPDPEHDPHTRPVAGLPVSVLVGLALVPFAIPLFWRVAPLVTGQEPALSLAVPVSLAIAASALCLGVVYTIDWTAATRVKGVLMLVGLSYLSAAGLFFLKKDLMDRVRGWDDSRQWSPVVLSESKCEVWMRGQVVPDSGQPLRGLVEMNEGYVAHFAPDPPDGPRFSYRFAVSKMNAVQKAPDDAWFDRVGEKLGRDAGAPPLTDPQSLEHLNGVGRQWQFPTDDGVRIVRVYVIAGRVYYLCAEGPKNLTPDDQTNAQPFFGKFS